MRRRRTRRSGRMSRLRFMRWPAVDAETRWGDDIYDLFPLPAELKVVKVFHLPGWNVNTCGKQHCAKTAEVGGIKIVKWRYRANKQLLEMSFDVTGINGSG